MITCSTNINNSLPIRHCEMQLQNEYRNVHNNLYRISNLYSQGHSNNNDPFFQFIRLLEQFNAMRMEKK